MPTISFLGVAHIHTPGFLKMLGGEHGQGFAVKAVHDHDAERAAKRAGEVGAAVAESAEAACDGVDAVVVCSETDLHLDLVKTACDAKVGLFVEKPLGMATADAYEMADLIEDADLLFQTGYFNRSNPAYRQVRKMVKAGDFGTVTRARGSNVHPGALKGWFDTEWRWMADPKRAGCGAFGDLGTHLLDVLLWTLGAVERVTAQIDPATGRYSDPGDESAEACDETGEGLIRFESRAVATLAGAWVDLANPTPLMVSGTDLHARVTGGDLYLTGGSHDGKTPFAGLPKPAPHAFELFLDAVADRPPGDVALVTAREAAYRVSVMDAMYRAAESNTWIVPE